MRLTSARADGKEKKYKNRAIGHHSIERLGVGCGGEKEPTLESMNTGKRKIQKAVCWKASEDNVSRRKK